MIGSYAGIRFTTSDSRILNFIDLARETSARYATHEVIGAKPKKEFLGVGLSAITFTIEANAQFGVNPKTMIRKLDSALKSGKKSNFVLGGWNLGKYVLTKKSDAFEIVTNRGAVIKAKLDISLEEYA